MRDATNEKIPWGDKPFPHSEIFIPVVVIICTFGIIGSWFFLVMSWNDIPVDPSPLFNIDDYKKHLELLRNELRDINCDDLAKNLLSDTYSKEYGMIYSDYDFAEKEYGYKCLGKERPVYTPSYDFTNNRRGNK